MVNNAGISTENHYCVPIAEFARDDLLDKTIAINIKGVFHGLRAAMAQMISQEPFDSSGDRGWIVNLGSIFGMVGTPTAVSYVMSKHAVHGLTRVAALEGAAHKIHVNAVCPGFLRTSLTAQGIQNRPDEFQVAASMHPWGGGGLGLPKDVSGVAVFLATEDARWMTGSFVTVDGGYTAL